MKFGVYTNHKGKRMVLELGLRKAFLDMKLLLETIGVTVDMTDGWRGEAEQNAALAAGTSKAAFGLSPHNFGLAFDATFVDSRGNFYWPENNDEAWIKVGKAGQKFNLQWGYDWDGDGIINPKDSDPGSKFNDRPHFQMKGWKALNSTLYHVEPPVEV